MTWLLALFPAMCAYGAFDIIRGFYYGDVSYITVGIIIACIGVNFGMLAPLSLAILAISGLATFFVSDWHYSIGIGVAIIAIISTFSLISTYIEREANR